MPTIKLKADTIAMLRERAPTGHLDLSGAKRLGDGYAVKITPQQFQRLSSYRDPVMLPTMDDVVKALLIQPRGA